MELFEKARLKFGNSILSKKTERISRNVSYTNISLVKTIGIVWDATNVRDFTVLTKFCQKMHERNIDVKILGYFPEKELPDQYTAAKYLTCFRRKEVGFFFVPLCTEAESFIRTRFDVLIDINFRKLFPLLYVTSLSSAGFKVGLSDPETGLSRYDLMMQMKSTIPVEEYLNEVMKYLEMINSGSSLKENKQ